MGQAVRSRTAPSVPRSVPRNSCLAAKAIAYGTKRWASLTRFLAHGEKSTPDRGATPAWQGHRSQELVVRWFQDWRERAGAIYTVIETCKLNGV